MRDATLTLSASGYGFARLFVGSTASLGFALVPGLLALGQCEFDLRSTILEVHPQRHQSHALPLSLADQLADFQLMHQQFTGAQRLMIVDVPVVVRPNV